MGNKQICKRASTLEELLALLCGILDRTPPLTGPNTTSSWRTELSTPILVPLLIQGSPDTKVKTRSIPELALWPPAVISQTVRGGLRISVKCPRRLSLSTLTFSPFVYANNDLFLKRSKSGSPVYLPANGTKETGIGVEGPDDILLGG